MNYFQILDTKKRCPLVFSNDDIVSLNIDSMEQYGTWSYHNKLYHYENIEYAFIYAKNKSILECCPKEYKIEFETIHLKYLNILKSLKECRLRTEKICLSDMIPEWILREYNQYKNRITQHVLENYEKPSDYSTIVQLFKIIEDVNNRKLNFNEQKKKEYGKALGRDKIKYLFFKSATGRLSTMKGSFPIMSFKKNQRDILMPNHDLFVEFDFNAAEARAVLALLNREQPKIDIHEHNAKIFEVTREEAKKIFFSWLYDGMKVNEELEKMYERDRLLEEYYKDGKIITPYGRIMECDRYHAFNYLMQSTFAYIFYEQVHKVYKFLKQEKRESYICFLMHDSMVLDFKKEDKEIIYKIKDILEDTRFGNFKVNIRIGKNFGEMKKI